MKRENLIVSPFFLCFPFLFIFFFYLFHASTKSVLINNKNKGKRKGKKSCLESSRRPPPEIFSHRRIGSGDAHGFPFLRPSLRTFLNGAAKPIPSCRPSLVDGGVVERRRSLSRKRGLCEREAMGTLCVFF